MELQEAIEKLNKFDCADCRFATCEQCEINHGEVQAIRTIVAEINKLNKRIEYALDFAIDYDGEYNPETKRGNVEGLAMTIDDMVDALKGRLKGLEGENQ